MRFLFALINFLLLAGVLVLVGRKTVIRIFRTRRERINAELDEAESPLPSVELPPQEDIPLPLAEGAVDSIRAQGEKTLDAMRERFEADRRHQRREMLLETRGALIEKVLELTRARMDSTEYRSRMREKEDELVRRVAERMALTPADRALLAHGGVLPVRLTSAHPMSAENAALLHERADTLAKDVGGTVSFTVDDDPARSEKDGGGFRLRLGDTVYDCTTANRLYRLGRALNDLPLSEEDNGETLLSGMVAAADKLAGEIDVDVFQIGHVLSVSDGICWVDGLSDTMYGEVVEFVCGERGMVMDIQHDRVGCIIFGSYDHIESGSRVRRLGIMASIPVGEEMLGRVVDALGNPQDGKGRIWTTERRPIEYNAPAIPDRQSVSVPLHTGIKAIDALVPIGRGQRELIIGDRQTGKTAIAVDALLNQKGRGVICIYVAVGQKQATIAEIAERLEAAGAMEYTTLVCASASDSASLQYIAPFAGAAMSEYFMYKGQDVLIVYDDLSKHAVAYRELSLLLHRPSGREAYPGDIFYLHSRLLERSARISEEAGGGSVTALPIIETQAGDISAYIPTNVISITDGQIFLETDLFNAGQRPAINVGLSVSRVGGAAQTKLMKQIASHLRTALAQYRELAAFTQFGSDLDEATQKVLAAGARMMAALRQDRYSPLEDWEQVLLIYAVEKGYADKLSPEEIGGFSERLYDRFGTAEHELVSLLKAGKKLSAEDEERLGKALAAFAEEF